MPSALNIDKLSACPACDLLMNDSEQVKEGYISQCPRCKQILQHPSRLSIRNNFICVFVGLVFYFPAILLPMLQFTMLGNTESMSILNCVLTLLNTGNWIIGIVVLFTIVLVPLTKMMLIIFISTRVYHKLHSHFLAVSFKWYNHLNHWGMLDIFMLSIIVSAIKLNEDAELDPGLGLYAFVILLFTSALQTQLLNKKLIWTLIERHGE